MRRIALLALVLAAACRPDLGDRASVVSNVRVLAVRGEPPEVKPGEKATFDALVVGPDGTIAQANVAWAFCAAPKPPGENDVVSSACLGDDAVVAVDPPAPSAAAEVPGDACTLFGPDPPPGGYRPRDPDETGGYYQPVRARAPGTAVAFGEERVLCNLANAPTDAAAAYAKRYAKNRNPKLLPLAATLTDGTPIAFDHVPAGARVTLHAAWTPGDAEAYVAFDAATQAVVDRREAMRVSWFVTAGELESDRTGRAEDDPAVTSDDAWTAPDGSGATHLWVVLRDSRGGVDFQDVALTVVP